MLNDEEKRDLLRDQEAWRAFLRDGSRSTIVFPHHKSYSPEAIFCPSLRARVRFAYGSSLIWLAGLIPLCGAKGLLYRMAGVKIGRNVCISPGVVLDPLVPWLIELREGALLGLGSRIIAHEYTTKDFRLGRTRIGKDAVVGMFATVRAGVRIGDRAMVGANSFVNRDVPDGETVGGVPAKPLRTRTSESPWVLS
jgi:acetyltransferase-like isoleucine patch superfamily enzyme